MIRRRSAAKPESSAGVDFGWRTHAAITDWTAKVDTKASIILSISGVLLGFCVTLSTNKRVLAGLEGWHLMVERIGLVGLASGVVLAGLVVMPRLNRRKSKKIWKKNFIYFGHLRHWEPEKLRKELAVLSVGKELDVLSEQLVSTSKIAWFKHSCLQLSIWSVLIGVVLIFVSAVAG